MPQVDEQFQAFLAHCAAWFEANGVSALNTDLPALVSYTRFRDAFIRQEYRALVAPGESESTWQTLAERYGMKVSTIKYILYSARVNTR